MLYYTRISLNRNHSAISVTTVIGEERGEWDSIDIRFLNAKWGLQKKWWCDYNNKTENNLNYSLTANKVCMKLFYSKLWIILD